MERRLGKWQEMFVDLQWSRVEYFNNTAIYKFPRLTEELKNHMKWQENDIRWFKKKQSSSISILLTAIHKFRRSIDIERRTEKPRNDKKIIFVDLKKNRVFQLFSQLSTNFHNRQTEKVKMIWSIHWQRSKLQLFQFFSKHNYPQISTIDRQKKWKTTKWQEDIFVDLQWNKVRIFQNIAIH